LKLPRPFFKLPLFSSGKKSSPGQFISSPVDLTNPRPLPYIRHEVPFVHQRHLNLCGDACVEMILAFQRKPYQDKMNNSRGAFTGLDLDQISAKLTSAGLRHYTVPHPKILQWRPEDLTAYLRLGGPILCNGTKHWVLLTGIHDKHVFVHDPWLGPNLTKTLREFNLFLDWKDENCMIVVR
jgi:hypothetical protein